MGFPQPPPSLHKPVPVRSSGFSPLAIIGMECRLPGARHLADFERLLFENRQGFEVLAATEFDRELYFHQQKGIHGKTYSEIGGLVPNVDIDLNQYGLSNAQAERFDPVHLTFCDIAIRAWLSAGFQIGGDIARRSGIFVGHSGATKLGGPLSLATLIDESLDFLNEVPAFQNLDRQLKSYVLRQVAAEIRATRPHTTRENPLSYHAYAAAELPAAVIGITGPRLVSDAACASSLLALQQAAFAIQSGRIDAAIVGGATTNGVDNLILFSHSQACSADGSCPFDEKASGLISSEGYAAIVLTSVETAERLGKPILGVVTGIGIASDGKGKSLWAPRQEGQRLAVQRGYDSRSTLDIDYLEAHATSTQLGDATELHALQSLLSDQSPTGKQLLIGSAKSNLGHTLETAGVAGLIKVLISLRREELPASVKAKVLSKNFDWENSRIHVLRKNQAWKAKSESRRAAVSAFGIGGLNAHVVVQDRLNPLDGGAKTASNSEIKLASHEPIAIVGRGVVLPGANDLVLFQQLIESGRSAIGPPPAGRFRTVENTSQPDTPRLTRSGGYVRDFKFDSQKYRIPPKQVLQANPLQMMLLDAVTQAVQEFDGEQWSVDKERTGVVIGTPFGGDFGGNLQLGLRLPELAKSIREHLLGIEIPAEVTDEIVQEYRLRVLAARPALLDETGSFTASTLASRIAKAFDLMGGACAIDAEQTSSLAALQYAVDQLRSGNWDLALCGTGERSMDLMKFQELLNKDRLVESGLSDDIPDDGSKILPGEGACVVALQRLSDAVREGRKILGVIEDVQQISAPIAPFKTPDVELARQIGNIAGAQSLIQIVKQSLQTGHSKNNWTNSSATHFSVHAATEDGQSYVAKLRWTVEPHATPQTRLGDQITSVKAAEPIERLASMDDVEHVNPELGKNSPAILEKALNPLDARNVISFKRNALEPSAAFASKVEGFETSTLRLGASSHSDLMEIIDQILVNSDAVTTHNLRSFNNHHSVRVAILFQNSMELLPRLKSIRKKLATGRRRGVFETERALLWTLGETSARTAWLYPGQGSHYEGIPSAIQHSPVAQTALRAVDAEFKKIGMPALEAHLKMSSTQLLDIWWNQAWMLGMSVALTAELLLNVRRPDVILGHSFGEYTALLTSGVLTLPQVVRMVKKRSDSIVMGVRDRGQLISVRSGPANLDAVLREQKLTAEITHFNAPNQTVIATDSSQVESVQDSLSSLNLASVVLPVPVAYHTKRLIDSEQLLALHFQSERFLPAVCPILSATTARYLVEPGDLRQSLIQQMTRPVLFVPAVERLIADGVGLFIEVGPNQVLSRLAHETVGDHALCLSLDIPGRHSSERAAFVQLAEEVISCNSHQNLATLRTAEGRLFSSENDSETFARQLQVEVKKTNESAVTKSSPNVESEVEIIDFHRVKPVVKAETLRQTDPKSTFNRVTPNVPRQAIAAHPDVEVPIDRESLSKPLNTPSLKTPAVTSVQPDLETTLEIRSEMLNFLITVVIDQTGYPADIIDEDADLESELGVDSIKKAQIIGELAEQFELKLSPVGVKFGDFNTLAQIATLGAGLYQERITASDDRTHLETRELNVTSVSDEHAATARSSSQVRTQPIRSDVAKESVGHINFDANFQTTSSPVSVEAIETFLIDLVIDQTGYSPDLVDLDADLEAELGIDSIKQAQMLGEVQQQFEVNLVTQNRSELSSFTTLRTIVNFLKNHLKLDQIDSTEPNRRLADLQEKDLHSEDVKKKSIHLKLDEPATLLTSSSAAALIRGTGFYDDLPDSVLELLRVQSSVEPFLYAQTHRDAIRELLSFTFSRDQLSGFELHQTDEFTTQYFREFARGAGVAHESVLRAHQWARTSQLTENPFSHLPPEELAKRDGAATINRNIPSKSFDLSRHQPLTGPGTARFVMKMVQAPRREGMPTEFPITGPALVVGENSIANEIARKFRDAGHVCHQLRSSTQRAELEAELEKIWSTGSTPHLFLTMSHDVDSLQELSSEKWKKRRFQALELPYRVCQLWMQKTIDEDSMDGASVVLLTNLGGDFGFSGESAISPEGGLAGLVKAMLIECWMRGFRATPMKVIDVSPTTTAVQAVNGIWGELAVPNYDLEVAFDGDERLTVQPIHVPLFPPGELKPIPTNGHSQIHRGGVWVVTGGARGITSYVTRNLAKRHQLKLQLIGTASVPDISDEVRKAAQENRLALRREVMRLANNSGHNGMEAWRNFEKALEIDATLRLLKSEGIQACYYSCDVSKNEDLQATLQKIRDERGPIQGVIHGAGIGQDARFDRKRADKVDQCLKAKIDGCLNLMELTKGDSLDWFVCFGSISGRFGANGHTDYSLANDSLAKLTDLYRRERPDIRSVTFHWHAWGDIGMATKPETKLALEMIQMEFMPAAEGLAHFLHELEHGGDDPEVLITDRAYIRKFYPIDRLLKEPEREQREMKTLPFLGRVSQQDPQRAANLEPSVLTLDAKKENFLSQHVVLGKPTLPFVIALELMCESARQRGGGDVSVIRQATAKQALKWGTDRPVTLRLSASDSQSSEKPSGFYKCQLTSDLLRADGRVVQADKLYFECEVLLQSTVRSNVKSDKNLAAFESLNWEPILYQPVDAAVYHGPDFQCLQKISVKDGQAIGMISASSTVQLGGDRPTYGWSLSPAVFDACLYACGLFAAKKARKSSLPVSFAEIRIGRLPDPGEICHVIITQTGENEAGMTLDFELIGMNRDKLLEISGYEIGWLTS